MANASSTLMASRTLRLDHGTRRICTESGISLIKDKLITLKELETGLKLSVKEAEQAEKSEAFWSKALVAAKFAKVTCDVIIDVMAEWVPNQKMAGLIKKGYDQKEFLADASVGKVDLYRSPRPLQRDGWVAREEGQNIRRSQSWNVRNLKRVDIVKDGTDWKIGRQQNQEIHY